MNAYVMVYSDDVGNYESVNSTAGYELASRDQGYRVIEWAHLYHTYRVGAVWFDQDEDRFHQVLLWCEKKQKEYKDLLDSAKPYIASYFLGDKSNSLNEIGIPDDSINNLIRLSNDIDQGLAWSPISVFWDSDEQESVIPKRDDFTELALVPVTINMYNSWTYNDFLEPILSKVDTQFPIKTLGMSDSRGMT